MNVSMNVSEEENRDIMTDRKQDRQFQATWQIIKSLLCRTISADEMRRLTHARALGISGLELIICRNRVDGCTPALNR